jgi:hypothetical protein
MGISAVALIFVGLSPGFSPYQPLLMIPQFGLYKALKNIFLENCGHWLFLFLTTEG